MSTPNKSSKPRVLDIALQAGVSTSTVDRVLNKRPGVRQKTIDKVRDAMARLDMSTRRPTVIPSVPAGLNIDVVLAQGAGFANDVLARAHSDYCRKVGLNYRRTFSKRMVPGALCAALDECLERGTDGVIVQPLDHPTVRDAVARLMDAGVPVICILTDLPSSNRLAYVGLDNRAAGRAAGLLLGRLCNVPGDVALFSAGGLYRSHKEREAGFRSVLRDNFQHINILKTLTGGDDPQRNYEMAQDLLRTNDKLRAICNVGGANRGIEKALLEAGKRDDITYCAFNLTPLTRQGLLSGVFDVVIHQDMGLAARTSIDLIVQQFEGKVPIAATIPTELIMVENLP